MTLAQTIKIKKWFTCFLFLFSLSLSLQALSQTRSQNKNQSSEWKKASVPGVDDAWENSKYPNHLMTFVQNTLNKSPDFKNASKIDVASGISAFRKITLQQFGFTNWKLIGFDMEKQGANQLIKMSGSYQTPDKKTVQFFEYQVYSKDTYKQYSYLIQTDKPFQDTKEIHKQLQRLVLQKQRLPAEAQTEGEVCLNCAEQNLPELPAIDPQKIQAANAEASCGDKPFLVNTEQKSILESMGMTHDSDNYLTMLGRSSLTCQYGIMSGAYKSLRDLVLAIPTLLGLTWKGVKATGNAVVSGAQAVGKFDFGNFVSQISPQKIKSNLGQAFEITKESTVKAFTQVSESLHESYEAGGVTGAIAAIGQAAYNSSPHAVIGKYMADIGSKIAEAINNEWKGFRCLESETQTQILCSVFSYVAVDILTGKILFSALTKSDKIKKALLVIRARIERLPIAGVWLTKHLKNIEKSRCEAIAEKAWVMDAVAKTQNANIDVFQDGDKIIARGIDPKTMQMGCFEIVGKVADDVRGRMNATTSRSSQQVALADKTPSALPNQPATQDFFSAGNTAIARTDIDFVAGVNQRVGTAVSSKNAKKISEALKQNPNDMDRYSSLHRNVDELKKKITAHPANSPEAIIAKRNAELAQETINKVNESLIKSGGAKNIKMDLINEALSEAALTGKADNLFILNRALYEFNKNSGSGTTTAALKAWEADLLKNRKHLKSEDIKKAQQCLFEGIN